MNTGAMTGKAMNGAAADAFAAVDAWIFDLDNTLYPADCDLFAQIDQKMTAFVGRLLDVSPAEARALQKRYYLDHGTTLNGLMIHHGVDPDAYLDDVHDIDLSPVSACGQLAAAIARLPGRRFVFTNGSLGHADRVVRQRGLEGLFDGMFSIACTGFAPKPLAEAYDRFQARFEVEGARAAMFEDIARNLLVPHARGMVTVLVHSEKDWSHEPEGARPAAAGADLPHVRFQTGNLTGFLESALDRLHNTATPTEA